MYYRKDAGNMPEQFGMNRHNCASRKDWCRQFLRTSHGYFSVLIPEMFYHSAGQHQG